MIDGLWKGEYSFLWDCMDAISETLCLYGLVYLIVILGVGETGLPNTLGLSDLKDGSILRLEM